VSDFPVERAREHIEALAAKHKITVYEIQRVWSSEAYIERRTVYVTDPTTPLRYMLALHEIGHIVDKVSAKVVFNHLAACEAAAWQWAYDNADDDLLACVTNRDWRLIARGWVSQLGPRSRQAAPSR